MRAFFRGLLFLILLAAVVWGAVWFADNPGLVRITWLDFEVSTSVGIAIILVIAAAFLVILALWLLRSLLDLPGLWNRLRSRSRTRRGLDALTKGMVAVAAGDPEEAQRQARRAEDLLPRPAPLSRLLAAQAAQLDGDEAAASRHFAAMLEDPQTEFLGIRGLLNHAVRNGDHDQALRLAERAFDLQPNTPWVLRTLFERQIHARQWHKAEQSLTELIHRRLVDKTEGHRLRGLVAYQRATVADRAGETAEALEQARKAHKRAPDHVPSAVLAARMLIIDGRPARAQSVVENTWSHAPHPALAAVFRDALAEETPYLRVNRFKKLLEKAPNHPESHIALAEVCLEAEIWGEARTHLQAAAGDHPSGRVCRLMARLEEAENHDGEAAGRWLEKAADAPSDPAWICQSCGAVAAEWELICHRCGALDSQTWQAPEQPDSVALTPTTTPTPATATDVEPESVEAAETTEPETETPTESQTPPKASSAA